MQFLIGKEQLERIANYLAQRPWAEVHEMIDAIKAVRPAPPPEVPVDSKTE